MGECTRPEDGRMEAVQERVKLQTRRLVDVRPDPACRSTQFQHPSNVPEKSVHRTYLIILLVYDNIETMSNSMGSTRDTSQASTNHRYPPSWSLRMIWGGRRWLQNVRLGQDNRSYVKNIPV